MAEKIKYTVYLECDDNALDVLEGIIGNALSRDGIDYDSITVAVDEDQQD